MRVAPAVADETLEQLAALARSHSRDGRENCRRNFALVFVFLVFPSLASGCRVDIERPNGRTMTPPDKQWALGAPAASR